MIQTISISNLIRIKISIKKRAKIYIVFLVELTKVKDLHLGRKNVKPGSGIRRFQGKMCVS